MFGIIFLLIQINIFSYLYPLNNFLVISRIVLFIPVTYYLIIPTTILFYSLAQFWSSDICCLSESKIIYLYYSPKWLVPSSFRPNYELALWN
jgi:hypothetical protein